MSENIEIKKELTESEFTQIFDQFQKNIEENTDSLDLGKYFQDLIRQITPAKEVQLLLVLKPDEILQTVTLEENKKIDISLAESILSKCYQTKEVLLYNDVARNIDYNQDIDNFLDYPLKDLLLIPLLNNEKEIEGIIWTCISQKDFNQYTQNDINYVSKISAFNEKIIEEIQKLREESEERSNPSVMKKLKSWLMG